MHTGVTWICSKEAGCSGAQYPIISFQLSILTCVQMAKQKLSSRDFNCMDGID